MEFTYTSDENIRLAIMSKIPIVFVEGKDDVKFYELLCKKNNIIAIIKPVDIISDIADGCDGVIEISEKCQNIIDKDQKKIKLFLGIIDKDSRYYRNKLPKFKCILILKHYSYESHFLTNYHVEQLVHYLTNYTEKLDNEDFTFLYESFEKVKEDLYYIGLEALKNAVIKGYSSVIGYDHEAGYILHNMYSNNLICNLINAKKDELDEFAINNCISKNDLFNIVKGKWLFHIFYNKIYEKMKIYNIACSKGRVNQCKYCLSGQTEKCLRKLNSTDNIDTIMNLVLNLISDSETEYIQNRLKVLVS